MVYPPMVGASVITIHGYLVCIRVAAMPSCGSVSFIVVPPTVGVRGIWFSMEFPLFVNYPRYRRHLEFVTPYVNRGVSR